MPVPQTLSQSSSILNRTTSNPSLGLSVMGSVSTLPPRPPTTATHPPGPLPPARTPHTLSKSRRALTSSSRASRASLKSSSSSSNLNIDNSSRSSVRKVKKPAASSSSLSSTISYPPTSTLEPSPDGKETALAHLNRVERNTIHVDHRVDLLSDELEGRIAREVDRRVGLAIVVAREQWRKDSLNDTQHLNAGLPSSTQTPRAAFLTPPRALLPPLASSLPSRPSPDITLRATKHLGSGTTGTKPQVPLSEPRSIIVTLSPECPAFSTTIDFLFNLTRDWSTEVERHTNSFARLPIPSRIDRVDSHHLLLTFNAFRAEAFVSTWNRFHDAINSLSHLSISHRT
ncbi:hypothetical protein C8R42DRAFT_266223 [Lentinula raphanica]|nr:hypothetical protein C8R42DRAFT_266223 [Lentinula raphanica]